MKLDRLNQCSDEEFIKALGAIFEHSPWVAEAVCGKRPFASEGDLHKSMCGAVDAAGNDLQLRLIKAHPDLAGKAALSGELTDESTSEQAGAGLDQLSAKEYETFHKLNDTYQVKFGFPFIIAVKGHNKHSILEAFRNRLENSVETEKQTALEQVYRIASFRLNDLFSSNRT